MGPGAKTALIIGAGTVAGVVGYLAGAALGGQETRLGLVAGLTVGVALHAILVYQIVK